MGLSIPTRSPREEGDRDASGCDPARAGPGRFGAGKASLGLLGRGSGQHGDMEEGDVVRVVDTRGYYVATGWFDPHSQIRVRSYARTTVDSTGRSSAGGSPRRSRSGGDRHAVRKDRARPAPLRTLSPRRARGAHGLTASERPGAGVPRAGGHPGDLLLLRSRGFRRVSRCRGASRRRHGPGSEGSRAARPSPRPPGLRHLRGDRVPQMPDLLRGMSTARCLSSGA